MEAKQQAFDFSPVANENRTPTDSNDDPVWPPSKADDGSRLTGLPQDLLNISNKVRSNLMGWRGQFSPQLIEAILKAYAPTDGLVLDPFVGSGTVLCESARLNFSAFGAEINPAAIKLAQVYYFMNMPMEERMGLLQSLDSKIRSMPHPGLDDLSQCIHEDDAKNDLIDLYHRLPESSEKTLMETLVVTLDFHSEAIPFSRVISKWKALQEIVAGLPYSLKPISLELCDARCLPLDSDSVDIVITSPPYINVFNYHQQYRVSMEALGWRPLRMARSEIGSNRKHRQNRFLTVIQYCLDMTDTLLEIQRVSKTSAHIVMVVGRESNVRKTPFFNGDIVENLASGCTQLRCALRQERVFKNKFGKMIREDVLHLVLDRQASGEPQTHPKEVAREVLESAKSTAPEESIPDLCLALKSVDLVKPSPICKPAVAKEV